MFLNKHFVHCDFKFAQKQVKNKNKTTNEIIYLFITLQHLINDNSICRRVGVIVVFIEML